MTLQEFIYGFDQAKKSEKALQLRGFTRIHFTSTFITYFLQIEAKALIASFMRLALET